VSLVSIRHARHAAGILALIAGVAHRSDAQTRAWDDYCTTGSLQMCMSIGVSFTVVSPFGTPLTLVTLTLQNLEGSFGSTAWGLQSVFISNLALDGQPITAHVIEPSAPAFEGNAQDHGVPTAILSGLWLWNTTTSSTASFDRETQLGDGGYPIAGCSPLTANPGFGSNHGEIGYFSTCGDAAIQYSFLMPQVEFTNATTLSIIGFVDQASQPFSCTFGVDCVSVTPEPSTFALVGAGLAAVGMFGRRRRRRLL
jgi:hypothetical protein